MKTIYFDNAATTPLDNQVLESMIPWLQEGYGNASSLHGKGRTARLGVETARKKIAAILDCSPQSIVFTCGGTESANTAINGVVAKQGIGTILTSATEHKCVIQPVTKLLQQRQLNFEFIPLDNNHTPSMFHLDQTLEKRLDKCLVAIMHANNETGAMVNLAEMSHICQSHNAILFSDTVCTMGHLPINLRETQVDICSASAHKFHGPKGIGFLYLREGLEIAPLILGGSHEHNLRAGTENVAAIVGMATALEITTAQLATDRWHISALRLRMQEILTRLGAVIHSPENGLYTILSAGLPQNERTNMLIQKLDMLGICVSGGSACTAGKGSHVMEAIGAGESVNIRFSFSRINTMAEVEEVGAVLEKMLQPATATYGLSSGAKEIF